MLRRVSIVAVLIALVVGVVLRQRAVTPEVDPLRFDCLAEPRAGSVRVQSNPTTVVLEWSPDAGRVGLVQPRGKIVWREQSERKVRELAVTLLEPLTSGLPRTEREGAAVASVRVDCGAGDVKSWDGTSPVEASYLNCRRAAFAQIPTCLRVARMLRSETPDRRAAAIKDSLERFAQEGGWSGTESDDDGFSPFDSDTF